MENDKTNKTKMQEMSGRMDTEKTSSDNLSEMQKPILGQKKKWVRGEIFLCPLCSVKVNRNSNSQIYCNKCSKKLENKRKAIWRKKNRDKMRVYGLRWYYKNKERCRKYKQKYYLENKDKFLVYKKKWEKDNKEYLKEYRRVYSIRHPDVIRRKTEKYRMTERGKIKRAIIENRRRMTKKNNPLYGKHTYEEWIKVRDSVNGICPSCKIMVGNQRLTIDHIVPISLCGSDNISNIQPLCNRCNAKKQNKIIKYI